MGMQQQYSTAGLQSPPYSSTALVNAHFEAHGTWQLLITSLARYSIYAPPHTGHTDPKKSFNEPGYTTELHEPTGSHHFCK